MTNTNVAIISQKLRSFRSRLFEIGLDEENSREELSDIFDEYQELNLEPFVEEFLIAGFETEIVRKY